MDIFGCDYGCRTVGEASIKYNIPDDWDAEFDACDDIYPIVCIQVERIRKIPAIMDLKLRIVENEDDEYAGCMVLTNRKIIAFKINYMDDLTRPLSKANC